MIEDDGVTSKKPKVAKIADDTPTVVVTENGFELVTLELSNFVWFFGGKNNSSDEFSGEDGDEDDDEEERKPKVGIAQARREKEKLRIQEEVDNFLSSAKDILIDAGLENWSGKLQ
ncbi:hypothetical protein OCU04_002386 [Sclerotinia nivalis]|uniref:Uncharacterized protein n=1 Tax=Sclerotinia nivalis TaxID=352851 RepID=A0A9X0DP05_9HELO|nr:hypothetical protein OCU04_002386 [Sclerotinia nivalis]